MKGLHLALIYLLFSASILFAQNPNINEIDSIANELQKEIKENKNDTAIASAYYSLAQLVEQKNPDAAIQTYQKAINMMLAAIEKAPSSKEYTLKLKWLLADSYNNIGALYVNSVKIPQALDYDYRSLKIREEIGNKKGIAESLNNIAFIHHYYLDDLVPALRNYLKALKLFEEAGDKQGESALLHNIASVYYRQGDTTRALESYFKSLKLREETNDKQGVSDALNNISVVYRAKGDIKLAFEFGNESLQIRNALGDKPGAAYALWNLGEAYLVQGNLTKAKEYGQRSLQIGKVLSNPNIIKLSSFLLQKIFKQQGRWEEALQMNELYVQMRDSTGNAENKTLALRQQVKYEYEKRAIADSVKYIGAQKEKDLKIQRQEAVISKERTFRNATISIAILVIIIAMIVFNNVKIKARSAQLSKANEIRQKISRDLHDEIGAELTAITMLCRQGKTVVLNNGANDPELLGKIRSQSESVNEKLSEVVWATNPENDNLPSLVSYMRHYVSQFFDANPLDSPMKYSLDLPDEIPALNLKPDVSRNLFFVMKEALNNCVKHSEANQVNISFRFSLDGNYKLTIEDTGKGFNPVEIPLHRNGLGNMRKRIEEIGGSFIIRSENGKGTQMEIIGNFS